MALSMLHVHGLLIELISGAELCLGTKEVKCLLLGPVSLKRSQLCAERLLSPVSPCRMCQGSSRHLDFSAGCCNSFYTVLSLPSLLPAPFWDAIHRRAMSRLPFPPALILGGLFCLTAHPSSASPILPGVLIHVSSSLCHSHSSSPRTPLTTIQRPLCLLPPASCSMELSQLEPNLTPTCFSSLPLAHVCMAAESSWHYLQWRVLCWCGVGACPELLLGILS